LVVHEDNHTGGFGAEVLATVGEQATRPVRFRRVTRADTPVPYTLATSLKSCHRTHASCNRLPIFWVAIESGPVLFGSAIAARRG